MRALSGLVRVHFGKSLQLVLGFSIHFEADRLYEAIRKQQRL